MGSEVPAPDNTYNDNNLYEDSADVYGFLVGTEDLGQHDEEFEGCYKYIIILFNYNYTFKL